MSMKRLLDDLRPMDWFAIGVLLIYVAGFSWMTIRQHESFQTNALDLAKFDQAIWNTAQGRPYKISLIQQSIVQSHFSPILAIYAPLYWLWPDIRLLLILQSVCLAAAGFLIYRFFRDSAPWLGLSVFLAYLMHPTLHHVNLSEFRRVTTAVLGTSAALYCLFKRRYGAMVLGLTVALLSKENAAFLVVGTGLYLIFVHAEPSTGLPVLLVGAAWLVLVPFVVLPALGTPQFLPHNTGYSLAGKYFSYLGRSPVEMLRTLLRSPSAPLAYILRPKRLKAVLRFSWPTGFLFLLAPEVALFGLPFLGYLLASNSDAMGQLAAWYPALLLPLIYWAAAVGVSRLHDHWRAAALIVLLVAATAGYVTLSEIRPERWPAMTRFRVTEHHRQVELALREVPEEAVVVAQDPLVPHLSHREHIYLFPWFPANPPPEYIILDREMRTYPVERPAYRTLFHNLLAGTAYEIDQQIDSFIIFRYGEEVRPAWEHSARFGKHFTLEGYDIAAAPPGKAFGAVPVQLPAGSKVRLSLFWHVDQPTDENYTVFVHAMNQDARLLAQHDGWPADAHRPTSVLPCGTVFRDVHYLTLPQTASSNVVLHVGLYDSKGDRLLTQENQVSVTLPLHR